MWLALLLVGCTTPAEVGGDSDSTTLSDDAWNALPLRDRCFPTVGNPESGVPDYDRFDIDVGRHCAGTDHQDIAGIGRVVFVGDSVTAGTPPTPEAEFYRNRVAAGLTERFGADLAIVDCSEWGAENDDLIGQLEACVPTPPAEKTLIVMTMGGNDMFALARDLNEGASPDEIDAELDARVAHFAEGLAWIGDPAHFPAGVDVVFGNLYEFTDATGDLGSCPGAALFAFEGEVPGIREAFVRANEAYVKLAAETRTDVVFLLEHFCGHGFYSDDPTNECYRGPDTPRWFDGTCLHPTPDGHAAMADLFLSVIDGD